MTKRTKIIVWIICVAIALCTICIISIAIAKNISDRRKNERNAQLIQEYYNNKLSLYSEENKNTSGIDVVFLGDSLTDGCDLEIYYSEYSVSNRGIGGDTSYGLKDRLQVSAYDANPKVIVLLIGGNDILGGKSLESIYANYEEIISGIKQNLPNTKIVWCSLTALGNQWAKFNNQAIICNQKIKLLAEKYECSFVDLFTPLCNVETGEIFEEYTVEGVHLTHEGYLIISSKIKEALNNILEQ